LKKILITGGSGYLGVNLALALREYDVILASRNQCQNYLANQITGRNTLPMDITNIDSIRSVISTIRPNIVIHAAANKFVDFCEKHPLDCIDINVNGSINVAKVCMEHGVDSVVGISTDKACPPVRGIYGLTKATMEKTFCLLNGKSGTKFFCIRMGNIACSIGSAFVIWEKMAKNGIIESTGADMKRFFLTPNDAVEMIKNGFENIVDFQGCIIKKDMKWAKISNVLDLFVQRYNSKWVRTSERLGEKNEEIIVGEFEKYNTQIKKINGQLYYVIHPNKKVENPINNSVGLFNSEMLSEAGIMKLIDSKPAYL
jgi:FlaA1/EpsC-like NDP-sugar epimerase